MADFTRRAVCKGLGVLGAAILLDGCQPPAMIEPTSKRTDAASYPPPLTPEEFDALVGTVHDARAKAVLAPDAPADFIRRFVSFSPRILAAKRTDAVIGSVLVDPPPATVGLAVNLQLARERLEPALLHDDLGALAAKQYWRTRKRYHITTVPNAVNLFGDAIHKNRAILQIIISGELPPDKIVQANQDLESLIGRQLTFARFMVNGLPHGKGTATIRRSNICLDDQEGNAIPEGTIGVSLVADLIRLEMAGQEVLAISPAGPGERRTDWHTVSDAYYNFAVGQMIEAERAVELSTPRNAFEEAVVSHIFMQYRARMVASKKRLNWDERHLETYESQKHGKVDLMTQQIFLDI